jgi:hypothetical protein
VSIQCDVFELYASLNYNCLRSLDIKGTSCGYAICASKDVQEDYLLIISL